MLVRIPFIIAVDGPTGAGKGTLARRLARHLDVYHLDAGSYYRRLVFMAIQTRANPRNPHELLPLFEDAMRIPEGAHLRTLEVGELTSIISNQPAVRAPFNPFLRKLALERPTVIEGRGCADEVVPDAAVKIFLHARPEVRAERYYQERFGIESTSLERMLEWVKRRDQLDGPRLVPARDAHVIDSSDLDVNEVFLRARTICNDARKQYSPC